MKHLRSYITEFLLSKDNAKEQNELDIDIDDREVKELLTTYVDRKYLKVFKVRVLKTGNIELISDNMSFNGHTGLKFVLYIKSNPMCIRRMYKTDYFNSSHGWSDPPSKQSEHENIEDLMKSFNDWLNKKVTL